MELRDYLRILRAHWIAICLLTVIGAVAAYGYSALQPRVYTADASGYVAPASADGSTGDALAGDQLAQSKVTSFLDIGSWRSVAEFAIEDLGLDTSPEALVQRVHVVNPDDTVVIRVSASAGTPEDARSLAEAWIRGMVQEIEAIEGSGEGPSAAVRLLPGESARLPTAPSSPNTRMIVAIGAGVGLALGLAYAVLRRTLDRRIRTAQELERQMDVAVVGTLPLDKNLRGERAVFAFDETLRAGAFAHTEAMRELRTNLQYVDVDNPPRVIVVTSPLPGDGKSTTAANLAASLAASGQPVMLVDADLRRPVVAEIFGFSNDVGLSDVLAGTADIRDVARVVDDDGNLVVMPAGRTPPNPSEMLGSQRMRSLLESLAREMVVILDVPPTIPVADAAILSASADGTIIVVSARKSTYDMLQKALDNIRRTKGNVLGVVLNRVPRRGADAPVYGYGYGYGQYYGREEDDKPAGGGGRRGALPRSGRAARSRGKRAADDAGPVRRPNPPLQAERSLAERAVR